MIALCTSTSMDPTASWVVKLVDDRGEINSTHIVKYVSSNTMAFIENVESPLYLGSK